MSGTKFFAGFIATSVLLLAACSNDMKFQQGQKTAEPKPKESVVQPPAATRGQDEVLKFKADVFLREAELDVVWVVDNSTSMSEEIAHVKNNLRDFVDHVSQFSNLRTFVLSKTDPADYDAKFTVDVRGYAGGNQLTAFDHLIGSKDALFWASKLVCTDKADCPETLKYPYCQHEKCKNYFDDRVERAATEVLRPNARKAFVFVTDDESSEISMDRFLKIYGQKFDVARLKVFSFVTLSKDRSPCGDSVGKVYQALSERTNGKSFNICDPNWRPHFQQIAEALEKSVKNRFALRSSAKVKKVVVDGRELAPSEYFQEGSELKIDEQILLETSEIEVTVARAN